jgi:hypothetical protein
MTNPSKVAGQSSVTDRAARAVWPRTHCEENQPVPLYGLQTFSSAIQVVPIAHR